MLDLQVDGNTASFHTASTLLGTGSGAGTPYKTFYRLELEGKTLRITRRNDVATGGAAEQFAAQRATSNGETAATPAPTPPQ